MLTSGNANTIILSAIELRVLKLELKVLNNPTGEMVIRTSRSTRVLKGSSNNIILDLSVLPNAINNVYYNIWDAKIGKYRGIIENIQIGAAPITIFQKTIQNTDDFPITP